MTRPGRGAAAVTVEHVDGGGGVAAVVGVEEVRPLRGQHAGHNNLLTGEYIPSGARRRWTDRRYYTGNMSRPRCYTAVRAGLTISMNILKPKGYKKQSYCPIPDGGLPVEGAGEVVEEVWLGPAEVGEPVLLRQEHGVAVPGHSVQL